MVVLVAVVVFRRQVVDVVVLVLEPLQQFFLALLEGIGDVLQEDQAQHYVLVVGGIQVGAELVGGFPEFVVQGFEELLFRVVHCSVVPYEKLRLSFSVKA